MVLVSAYVMKKQYTRACLGFTPYFVVDLIFCAIEILVILFFFYLFCGHSWIFLHHVDGFCLDIVAVKVFFIKRKEKYKHSEVFVS